MAAKWFLSSECDDLPFDFVVYNFIVTIEHLVWLNLLLFQLVPNAMNAGWHGVYVCLFVGLLSSAVFVAGISACF